jgi:hypothetical protein
LDKGEKAKPATISLFMDEDRVSGLALSTKEVAPRPMNATTNRPVNDAPAAKMTPGTPMSMFTGANPADKSQVVSPHSKDREKTMNYIDEELKSREESSLKSLLENEEMEDLMTPHDKFMNNTNIPPI